MSHFTAAHAPPPPPDMGEGLMPTCPHSTYGQRPLSWHLTSPNGGLWGGHMGGRIGAPSLTTALGGASRQSRRPARATAAPRHSEPGRHHTRHLRPSRPPPPPPHVMWIGISDPRGTLIVATRFPVLGTTPRDGPVCPPIGGSPPTAVCNPPTPHPPHPQPPAAPPPPQPPEANPPSPPPPPPDCRRSLFDRRRCLSSACRTLRRAMRWFGGHPSAKRHGGAVPLPFRSAQVEGRPGWVHASGADVHGWYGEYNFDDAFAFKLNTTLPLDEDGPLPQSAQQFLDCLEVCSVVQRAACEGSTSCVDTKQAGLSFCMPHLTLPRAACT